ncbi:MAG: hypothetical protein HZB38_01850 [Planctomycetes bacterium]|nr:hypothetical protein [Planctomycetota bacterium]
MPFRVRCPHCHATLLADDEQAGVQAQCSECGKGFRMPFPDRPAHAAIEVATHCPRCSGEIAPGTTVCPRCLTDLSTGRKLPLGERIARWKFQTWAVLIGGAAIVFVGVWVALELRRNRSPSAELAAAIETATQPASIEKFEAAANLFRATNAAARQRAQDALYAAGSGAIAPLLEAFPKPESFSGGREETANIAAAIELLSLRGDAAAFPVLAAWQKVEVFADAAIRTRGMLGDAGVANELVDRWIDRVRSRMFLERAAALASPAVAGANRAAVDRARLAADRLIEPLRVVAQQPNSPIMERLLSRLFPSWSWLGQQREERLAVDLWEASKPPRESDQDFKFRVRAARRVLDQSAQSGSPTARAAAGVVLAQSGPQYESLRREITATLGGILSDCGPADQQCLTWAIARLGKQSFGEFSERSSPADVQRTTVVAALDWIRSSGLADPKPLRTDRQSYSPPPVPTLRVITPQRQLEAVLLPELSAGWEKGEAAVDRWLAGSVGFTPRISGLLDDHRAPNPTALACAMLIVAECDARAARPRLELWSKASDQPAWLRGVAILAGASLDAREGRGEAGWPRDLTAEMFRAGGADQPPMRFWGRLIHAGGPKLHARLRKKGSTLPSALCDTLLRAAEQAARREGKGS